MVRFANWDASCTAAPEPGANASAPAAAAPSAAPSAPPWIPSPFEPGPVAPRRPPVIGSCDLASSDLPEPVGDSPWPPGFFADSPCGLFGSFGPFFCRLLAAACCAGGAGGGAGGGAAGAGVTLVLPPLKY